MTIKDEAGPQTPPAVGEFALQERAKMLSDNTDLRAALVELNSPPVSAGDDPFWKVKLAIKFCEQRCIAENAPDRARAIDAFVTGLSIGSQHSVSAGDDAEQAAFEAWLVRVCPSGDADSVHAQWLESSDYEDFCDQAYDSEAERLTAEALGVGAGINPNAASIDDIFLPESAGGVDERAALTTLERFVETVRECYHLASSYSGCLDNVDEHGGDDHEDPICAVFHRLYYAMFDGEKGLEQARAALTASAPNHSEQVRDDRAVFDKWFRDVKGIGGAVDTTFIDAAFFPYKAFKFGIEYALGNRSGWQLVPLEPTPEMLQAGADEPLAGDSDDDAPEDYRAVYKAMLAAAPSAGSQEKGE